jgi:hypothetical protein
MSGTESEAIRVPEKNALINHVLTKGGTLSLAFV